jgi:NADH:ubiquinone oxidoreductase subunit B-like Fe-S oxidoreductase
MTRLEDYTLWCISLWGLVEALNSCEIEEGSAVQLKLLNSSFGIVMTESVYLCILELYLVESVKFKPGPTPLDRKREQMPDPKWKGTVQ